MPPHHMALLLLLEAAVDEIGLAGRPGCSLAALWARLAARPLCREAGSSAVQRSLLSLLLEEPSVSLLRSDKQRLRPGQDAASAVSVVASQPAMLKAVGVRGGSEPLGELAINVLELLARRRAGGCTVAEAKAELGSNLQTLHYQIMLMVAK
jgi:hypothetical protein